MSFLAGLNGTVAGLLICCLLLVDETGIPLPIAPNEALLLVTGVLVVSNAFPLWVIFPVAFLAMSAGMAAGYSWARAVGQSGLQALAARVHATEVYERAQRRLQSTSAWGVGLARMVPGVRPYATLVAGAAGVDGRTFFLGALPALLLWEGIWMTAGMLVGIPVVHLLGRFERLALRGAILLALGATAWLAIRNASPERRAGVARIQPRLRASLALVSDAAIVLSVVVGLFAIGRRIVRLSADGWIELAVSALLLTALLLIGRRRQTPGEMLFETNYWHHLADGAPAGPPAPSP